MSKRNRLLKNAHLLRFSHPSSLRRTSKYASLLRISRALYLSIFEQPAENHFFNKLESTESLAKGSLTKGSPSASASASAPLLPSFIDNTGKEGLW
jgi:hypothetical protein